MTLNTNKAKGGFLKKFTKSRDGNVSVLTAVTLLLAVTVTALAVDVTRIMQASSKLIALNDMAALAAINGDSKSLSERKRVYEDIMEIGLVNSPEITGYDYDLSIEDDGVNQVLVATSRSKAELLFPLAGQSERYVTAHSEVTVGKEFTEVTLVLDISTSMKGSRLVELKKSAKEFIDKLINEQDLQGRVSVAVVPFGGSVRLPSDLEYLLIPPSTTEHWIGDKWNGCVVTSPVDYASGLTPQHKLEFMPDFYGWDNNWCPEPGNELMGLSTDKEALSDRIDTLSLSDGTATDIGVSWGLATLDPKWRTKIKDVNNTSPRDFNARTKKIMVVMADGGVTGQRLPVEKDMRGSLPYQTRNKTSTTSEAENGYYNICDLTKDKGITVYTVGFEINHPTRLQRLQTCGSGDTYNYEVRSGELGNAFLDIASSISGIRLSK